MKCSNMPKQSETMVGLFLFLFLFLLSFLLFVLELLHSLPTCIPTSGDIRPYQENNAAIRKTKHILAHKPLPANWRKRQSSSWRSSRELASSRPMPCKAKHRVPGASLGSPWTKTM